MQRRCKSPVRNPPSGGTGAGNNLLAVQLTTSPSRKRLSPSVTRASPATAADNTILPHVALRKSRLSLRGCRGRNDAGGKGRGAMGRGEGAAAEGGSRSVRGCGRWCPNRGTAALLGCDSMRCEVVDISRQHEV